jgi:hypothetical protein
MNAEFNSPIFRKRMATSGQNQMKEFSVGAPEEQELNFSNDDEENLQIEKQIEAARLEKNTAPKITDHSKKRLEILTNIGRLTRDVNIEGYTFTIKSLKSKETREATLLAVGASASNAELSFEIRRNILARSIDKIDGKEIALILGTDDLERKLKMIDDFEEVIIVKLYDEFQKMKETASTKYGVNSDKDAAEVVEDLKK